MKTKYQTEKPDSSLSRMLTKPAQILPVYIKSIYLSRVFGDPARLPFRVPRGLASLFILLSCLGLGCSQLPKRHERIHAALDEESRALTTAVIDSLQLQPPEDRDRFSALALQFARQDQRLEGFPLEPFDPPALLEITNALSPEIQPERAEAARAQVAARFALQDQLCARQAKVSDALLQRGLESFREQNRLRTLWLKRLGWIGLPLAALVAAAVFCPALLPVVGRLLAWLVGKVPALSSALGVVSVKAFDAVVRGIERAKSESEKAPRDLANSATARAAAPDWPAQLYNHLSREMDTNHKRLVRQRKIALKQGA